MKPFALIMPVAVLLAGCAVTHDAVQVGPNRYQTSALAAPARGGIAGAQRLATERAAQTCAVRGMQVNVISVDTAHEFPINGTATVTFECLSQH